MSRHHNTHSAISDLRTLRRSTGLIESNYICVFTLRSLKEEPCAFSFAKKKYHKNTLHCKFLVTTITQKKSRTLQWTNIASKQVQIIRELLYKGHNIII